MMTPKTPKGPPRKPRRKLSESQAVLNNAAARRVAEPLIIRGLPPPKRVLLPVADMKKVNVDERYQRTRITHLVNRLIHVLKSGGVIPDAISLARRGDGSLWILDGQQRFLAHWDCEIPVQSDVFEVTSLEQEMQIFQALNDRVNVRPDILVKSWIGAVGVLVRAWSTKPEYTGHVNFGMGNLSASYGSTTLVRGILAASAGLMPNGSVKTILARADAALKDPNGFKRAEAYLRLIPLVFPPVKGRLKMLPAIALGRVAYRHWHDAVTIPSPTVYERLKRIRWDRIAPSHAAQFCPLLEGAIERIWKPLPGAVTYPVDHSA
jgi:hypothetical protein